MIDLWPIVLPILIAVSLSLPGAWIVARRSGPAQQALVAALEGRLRVVTAERDEAEADLPKLKQRVAALEQEVADLQSAGRAKDREITDLYRRLGAQGQRTREAGEA